MVRGREVMIDDGRTCMMVMTVMTRTGFGYLARKDRDLGKVTMDY